MRFLIVFLSLLIWLPTSKISQAKATNISKTNTLVSVATFKKTNEMDYEIRTASGTLLTNTMDLKFLKTNTLSVLDRSNRVIYLLQDFKDIEIGSSGTATILAENIGTNFYITNPNSFANYVNDQYVSSGKFTNVNGSYVYYDDGSNSTYYLDGIRNFPDWGAKTTTKLPFSASNTYWTRVADKSTYHIIKDGKSIDYTNLTTEQSGDDMLVKENGAVRYVLPAYYTTASYVYKPVEIYKGSETSTVDTDTASGCVRGNCENGWGKLQYENGYYDGFWENGKKNGYGLYKWNGVGKYIGNWRNDQMNGYGIYIADNEDNIAGMYQNGELNGVGYTVTGNKWEQGLFNKGTLTTPYTYSSNNVESGCTAGDCDDKYGKFVWTNGDTFIGFFKGGKMHLGTYNFSNGDKYSGTFNTENQFHGFGRYFFEGGGYYGGEWVNGMYEGKGYYHDKDYKKQVGIWKDGSLVKSLE